MRKRLARFRDNWIYRLGDMYSGLAEWSQEINAPVDPKHQEYHDAECKSFRKFERRFAVENFFLTCFDKTIGRFLPPSRF